MKNDGRTAFVRVFEEAYTSQVLSLGERVMNKYTAVPTGNLDQRWATVSGWQGANDRRAHHSHGKWGPESKIVALRATKKNDL